MKLSTRLPIGITLSDFASVRTCDEHYRTAAALVSELLGDVGPVHLKTCCPARREPKDFCKPGACLAFPETARDLIAELIDLAQRKTAQK